MLRFARIDAPLLAAAKGADRVLEIGVGTGRLLSQVSCRHRVGIDTSAAMLERAAERSGQGDSSMVLVRADAHALPFADESFDSIISGKGVFRYLDLNRALSECWRVLSPRGRLAFHQYSATTWSLRTLLRRGGDEKWRHLHVEDPTDLTTALQSRGFVTDKVSLFRSIRFYPYVISIPRRFAGRLWSHVVVSASKKTSRTSPQPRGVTGSSGSFEREPDGEQLTKGER